MLSVIADVLKAKLVNLEWLERFGGLVSQASKPDFATGADGAQVVKGYLVYPVSCEVNEENCWENGQFRHFEPDSRKSAIAFFVDNGGVTLKSVESPRGANLKFEFNLKFLCWMNTARLGPSITGGRCLPSGRISPYVISELFGEHSIAGVFSGGIEETIFRGIEVTSISEIPKSPTMFEPFTFARDGINRNLFISPYDYFGLNIRGEFVVNKNCLPAFGDGWQPTTGCLAPADNINWFNHKVIAYLAALPAFQSNNDALTGTLPGGGAWSGGPLSIGDPYWAANGHIAAEEGAFLRVI